MGVNDFTLCQMAINKAAKETNNEMIETAMLS
jgi:hypothetical protein